MKKKLLKIFAVTTVSSILLACANPGIPTGGPKDEEPPIVTKTTPENYSVNFKDKKIFVYFDEFVQLKDMSEKFVISPPQKKKPAVKLKGKSIVIELRDSLIENTTYTLDFADAIVDNNESNPLNDFQFVFSTGEILDSLSIQGYLEDAFIKQPIENVFVMVYQNTHDTIPLTQVPDYVAITDSAGHFAINNIRKQTYRIIALQDNNRDYIFDSPAEPVAFLDSLITPEAYNAELMDTISPDSIVLREYTLFSPADIHLRMFEEYKPQLYLTKYDRPRREKLEFHFSSERNDSLRIDLLDIEEGSDWFILEKNISNDTLIYWITDSLIYEKDTLTAELQYLKTDSLYLLENFRDTLKLNFKTKKKVKLTEKEKKKIAEKKSVLSVKTQIPSILDLNKKIGLEFDEPVNLKKELIHLYFAQDTLEKEQEFKIEQDSLKIRKYYISRKWQSEEIYKFKIDSAAFTSIYNVNNDVLSKIFRVQEAEYYGRIILNVSNVKKPLMVQLLKDDKKEIVLESKKIRTDQSVVFEYLYPKTYLIKVVVDENDNGKWDTGNYLEHRQPEQVYYFKNLLKVRSNWDVEESWELPEETFHEVSKREIKN